VGPAVEADADAVALKHAVHLTKGGFEPRVVVVVPARSSVARFVAGDIRRIGEEEADEAGGKNPEALDEALAATYAVVEGML
jgi:hypothetical protein